MKFRGMLAVKHNQPGGTTMYKMTLVAALLAISGAAAAQSTYSTYGNTTYQNRTKEARYSRRVEMDEIEKNDFNLNISRYISTAVGEEEISLEAIHDDLVEIESAINTAKAKHNQFLKELDLAPLP